MTVKELYDAMSERIPEQLREAWDNDGLMCCADLGKEVHSALVTLDVTEEIVDYAIENGFDLIVSHHPLIFRPVSHLTESDHVARKLIKLASHDVSVFSFHTRADKVEGGVNDLLAEIMELQNIEQASWLNGFMLIECQILVKCLICRRRYATPLLKKVMLLDALFLLILSVLRMALLNICSDWSMAGMSKLYTFQTMTVLLSACHVKTGAR